MCTPMRLRQGGKFVSDTVTHTWEGKLHAYYLVSNLLMLLAYL